MNALSFTLVLVLALLLMGFLRPKMEGLWPARGCKNGSCLSVAHKKLAFNPNYGYGNLI